MSGIEQARLAYADALRKLLGGLSDGVHAAFATVSREHYLGPGPWSLLDRPDIKPRQVKPDEPTKLYVNSLVVIDAKKRLNNGQPSLHAQLIDHLAAKPGDHVVHVGTGTGYYTAILAELVGPQGRVTGIEFEPDLAELAARNLAHLPHVEVRAGDGTLLDPGPADAFYGNAGATHVPELWLDRLSPGGRIIAPLTATAPVHTGGMVLLVERRGGGGSDAARFVSLVGIYPCVGAGRDPDLDEPLANAFRRGDFHEVRSLRRDAHEPEAACWLHTQRHCLSRAEPL